VVIDQDLARVRQTSSPYSSYRQIYLKTRFEEIEALHGRGPLADGETGMAPFAKPLHPVPDQAPAAPASAPSAASAPAAVAPPTPVAPPPVVFVAYPVVQSHPVVQPLPADYKPHSGH